MKVIIHKLLIEEFDDGELLYFETLCGKNSMECRHNLEASNDWDDVDCTLCRSMGPRKRRK